MNAYMSAVVSYQREFIDVCELWSLPNSHLNSFKNNSAENLGSLIIEPLQLTKKHTHKLKAWVKSKPLN